MDTSTANLTWLTGSPAIPSPSERIETELSIPSWEEEEWDLGSDEISGAGCRSVVDIENQIRLARARTRAAVRLSGARTQCRRQVIVPVRPKIRIIGASGRRRRSAHHGHAARATIGGSASGDDGGGGSDGGDGPAGPPASVVPAARTAPVPFRTSRRTARCPHSPSFRVRVRHPIFRAAEWLSHLRSKTWASVAIITGELHEEGR
jgi:hypothetical protein